MSNLSPHLPPHVLAKLADRGVTDEEGLVAAMQDDAVLRAEIQTFLAENQTQIYEWIIRDLMALQSNQDLDQFVQRAPFVLEDDFLYTLKRLIRGAQERGEQSAANGLALRLAALVRIRYDRTQVWWAGVTGDSEPAPAPLSEEDLLDQAVQAFLYASDEATARQVFAEAPDLLLSHDARQLLHHGIQADNAQSQRRLAERKTLLRKLRQESRIPPTAR